MEPIVLHQFQISPFCEKVRKLMDYKGLPYVRTEAPMDSRPEIKKRTGKTKVPVIVVGREWITDSTTIGEWLDERFPEKPVHPKNQRDRALNALLEDWADEALASTLQPVKWTTGRNAERLMELNLRRYPANFKNRALTFAAAKVMPRQMKQYTAMRGWKATEELFDYQLDRLNELLSDGPYIFGKEPMSADFACYGLFKLFDGYEGFERVEKRLHVMKMIRALDAVPSTCRD